MAQRQEYNSNWYDIFWNPNISKAKQNYQLDQQQLQSAMDALTSNDLKLKNIMMQEGLMNGDGSINADRFVNKNYMNALRQRTSEAEQTAISSAMQNAARNSQLNGQAGTNLGTAGMARIVNQSNIANERNFANQAKQEYDTARNITMQYGKQAQQDAINQAKSNVLAKQTQSDYDKEMASAQSLGLLQNPQTYAALIGAISGNPAGAVKKGIDALSTALGGGNRAIDNSNQPNGGNILPSRYPTNQQNPIDIPNVAAGNQALAISNLLQQYQQRYPNSTTEQFKAWINQFYPNYAF